VRINVYSTTGALVTTLDAGVQPAGTHSLTWNGRDQRGQSVASGVYFYNLEGSAEAPRKMVLLK
jgi:flagellar hook assembly protein FlgD